MLDSSILARLGLSSPAIRPGPTEVFARRLAVALRRYGTPAHRLEDHMASFAARVGLDGQFYVLPSAILASFDGRTHLVPMSVGAPSLERLVAVDALAEQVASGHLQPEEGLAALTRIEEAPGRYRWGWLAPAVASPAAVPLFGGGVREVAVALVVALGVAGIARLLRDRTDASRLIDVAAGVLAAIVVHAGAVLFGGQLASEVALLAGILVLLPGFTLTVAFTELATRHWISGTAGLLGGTLTLLQLGFGVAVGETLASQWLGPLPVGVAEPLPSWVLLASIPTLGAALTVDLQARPRDVWHITTGLGVSMIGATAGSQLLGTLGGAIGALALTIVSNALARQYDRPAAVTQVPGILLLVPGSIGFRSVSALQSHDVVGGIETAFATVLAAVGLVVGTLLGTALVRPRRAL